MYPQHIPISNRPVIRLLIGLIVVGGIVGLAIANLPGQLAGAQQTAVATSYQEQLNQLDVQKRSAQNAVDIKRIQLEEAFLEQQQQIELEHQSRANAQALDFQAQLNAQVLAHQESVNEQEIVSKERGARVNEAVKIGLAIAVGLAILILAVVVAILLLGGSQQASTAALAAATDARQSPATWQTAREKARAIERLERQVAILSQTAAPFAKSPNGRHRYSELPLAVSGDNGSEDHSTPDADGSRQEQG